MDNITAWGLVIIAALVIITAATYFSREEPYVRARIVKRRDVAFGKRVVGAVAKERVMEYVPVKKPRAKRASRKKQLETLKLKLEK